MMIIDTNRTKNGGREDKVEAKLDFNEERSLRR